MLLLTGCLATKKISKKSKVTTITEKTEIKKDSVSIIETNREIKDRIVINVPESDNEEVMRMFDVLLGQMNASKSSGSNSYKSTYDKETRQLVIDFIIGQTEDKKTDTFSDIKVEKSFTQQIDEYIKKIVIPWWIWVAVAYYFKGAIIGVLGFFFPQIGIIKTFSDFRRRKSKDN